LIKHAVSAKLPALPGSTADICASFEVIEDDKAQAELLKLLNDIGKIDIVKISVSDIKTKNLKSFISNINNAAGHAPTLVASGIEDSAMLAKYWELGIRNFQGYFIQKPDEELKYIDSEE